MDLVRMIKAIR